VLRFTRDYLRGLAEAFRSRAYDQVPFQLADAQNTHTNDPERTRGEITDMDVQDDGLWITAKLTPQGERVLQDNPRLGVSARIVEDYARSDGQHYAAAVQHVLGTLDPRIPEGTGWHDVEHDIVNLDIADLTGRPLDPDETLAEVRHQLGIGAPRARYRPDGPDVSGLAEGLGLR
jgi:hypothetical protein